MTHVLLACLVLGGIDLDADRSAKLDLLRTTYLANLTKFEHGSFSFRPYFGFGANLDSVKKGVFRQQEVGTGRLVFDSRNALFSSVYDDASTVRNASKVSETSHSQLLLNVQALTNKSATCMERRDVTDLEHAVVDRAADVVEDKDQDRFWTFYHFVMPFGVDPGRTDLLRDIQAVRDGGVELLECEVERDPTNGFVGRFGIRHKGQTFEQHYTIDLERGGIPTERRQVDNGTIIGVAINDRFERVNSAWMPRRTFMFRPQTGMTRGIEVTAIDPGKPAPRDFTLKFDRKLDVPDLTRQVVYRKIDHFSFQEAPPAAQTRSAPRLPAEVAAMAASAPVLPGEAPEPRWARTWIGVGCGAAGLALVFLWLRSRSQPGRGRIRGFTLIELLAVVAVLATLVGLLLPAVVAARATSRRIECASRFKQIALAVAAYCTQNDGFPPINNHTDFGPRSAGPPRTRTACWPASCRSWNRSRSTTRSTSRPSPPSARDWSPTTPS